MTDEQINIAIAESLGWKVRWQNQGGAPALENKPAGHCWAVWTNPNGWGLDSNYDPIFPPNYTSDLNACHECVKTLTDAQRTTYREHLSKIWTRDYNSRCGLFPRHDDSVNATARQRCEAYLRTIEKWKEKVND